MNKETSHAGEQVAQAEPQAPCEERETSEAIGRRNPDVAFISILLGFCAYAALFIHRTSFVINGRR